MDRELLVPPSAPAVSAGRVLARREQVLNTWQQSEPKRSPRRRRVLVMAALAAILAGGTATTAYALLKPAPVTQLGAGVGCFEEASLSADVTVVDLNGLDPVQRCREVWASGGMGDGREVPPLITCVYPSGALAVLPGNSADECEKVGLPQPEAGQIDKLIRFDALKQAILVKVGAKAGRCATAEEALQIVTSELRSHGFTDWTAELADGAAGASCVSLAFLGDRRVVMLTSTQSDRHLGQDYPLWSLHHSR